MVVARTSSRSVHKVMPYEREWISVLCCMNVDGASIPNFYIFKGKQFQRNYIEAFEARATMAMRPCAWMTSFLFAQWISHFVKSLEAMRGVQRHLIILDGHVSHFSIQTVKETCRYGIDLLTLSSHSSRAMQFLDVCSFKPFKTAFKAYKDYWNYKYLGTIVRKENLS